MLTNVTRELFLQYDIKTEPKTDDFRTFVFFSDRIFKLLCSSDLLVLDGTFYSSPKLFEQVYIFHFLVGEYTLPGI